MREATFSVSAVVMAVLTCSAHAQPFANARNSQAGYLGGELRPAASCADLDTSRIAYALEIAAVTVAAEGNVPEHCRVSGVLTPEIAFEVSLPTPWNGRLYMIGNGGHAGEALDNPGRVAQVRQGLQNGFAVAQTNTGHFASRERGATFVLSNPQKAQDYAHRAVHLTAVTAKEIAKRHYARPVAKSYWSSCSNGGRQGLIEAQRYPDDFDGIVANAPWVDQTGFTIGAIWNQRAFAETHVSADKLALVATRAMEQCDAVDGLRDGLIDDPRQCSFDVARDVPRSSPASRSAARPCWRGRTARRAAAGWDSSPRPSPAVPRPTSAWRRTRCATSCSTRRVRIGISGRSTSAATRRCSSAGARSRTRPKRTCVRFAGAAASC
jgi:feruloyl esterase